MDRKYPGFGLHCGRIGGRGDGEIDVTGPQFLQYLGLLAELSPRELVDDHRPIAQFLQLIGESVGRDAVGGRMWLIVGEAEMAHFGSLGARLERDEEDCQEDRFVAHEYLP